MAVETRADNGFRLTRAMLEAKATPRTKVLMLNFPNNPTGAVMSRADLEDIAAFARERDLIVITDEIYGELTYDAPHTSIVSLPGLRDRTIFLHGFSKAWAMTGFRLGYACGPAELIEAMMKIHQYTMLCASSLSQKAALEALARPETDIAEMVDEYRRRRNFIAAAFAEMGLECHRPLGAFYAFPSVAKFGLPAKEFSLAIAARGEGGGGPRHRLRGLRRGLCPLRLRHQHGEHQRSHGPAGKVHQSVAAVER